jgi:hypothetical protein
MPAAHLGGNQRRERHDDHDDGRQTPTPVSANAPFSGIMADVDTVDNVIEHIDQLRNHRWYGQFAQQRSDRFRFRKLLLLGFNPAYSFSMPFTAFFAMRAFISA